MKKCIFQNLFYKSLYFSDKKRTTHHELLITKNWSFVIIVVSLPLKMS